MNEVNNIVLIGMMGSGKTTTGLALSQRASLPFIDTDAMIEARLKMDIPHIFKQYGESYFRDQETEAARLAASAGGAIIATGGGMVINPQNMALLKKTGFVIYLYCNPQELYKRISGDKNRPLLDKLLELLDQRKPLYEKYSDLAIDSASATTDELSEMIWNEYNRYRNNQRA